MLPKDKQLIQELISHPGWEIYKNLVLVNLKSKLQGDLMSSARSGEAVRGASFAGQIDILPVVLDVPIKYLKG